MSSISIDPTKHNRLSFNINIIGSTEKPSAHFIIPVTENISLAIKAAVTDGTAVVNIPPIAKYITEGGKTVDALLEVQVEDNIFRPWNGEVLIEHVLMVEANVTQTRVEEVKPPEKHIEMEPAKVTATANIEENTKIVPKKKLVTEAFGFGRKVKKDGVDYI